jgi:hypothetical protein
LSVWGISAIDELGSRFLIAAMRNLEEFSRRQIEECQQMAKRAGKEDRAFWQKNMPVAKSRGGRSYSRTITGGKKEDAA